MSSTKIDAGLLIVGDGSVRENVRIDIREGRIVAVGSDGRDDDFDRSVDASDQIVMPGLIDAHVHLNFPADPERTDITGLTDEYLSLRAAELARDTLQSGTTTVADVASRGASIFSLRDAIADGVILGPRVKASGGMIAITGGRATYGHTRRNEGVIVEVDGPTEARKKARELLMYQGADLIKLAATGALSSPHTGARDPQLTVEEMKAATEEAHKCGRPVHAHCYGETGISNALEAGVDVIAHGQSLTDDHIETMLEQDSMLVPTLATFRTLAEESDADPAAGERERPDSSGGVIGETEQNFKRALEAGIPIAAGTDCGMPKIYHGTNPVELVHYVEWGMSPEEAIVAGTQNAARALYADDELGTIEPGKHADLLVLDENPHDDISVLTDTDAIDRIMVGGTFVEEQ